MAKRKDIKRGKKRVKSVSSNDRRGGARLIFPPSPGKPVGFTSISTSQFSNEPASCVRELIQNSLDASVEINQKTAKIRFSIVECSTSDIPGMAEYKQALESALRGKRNEQTENVTENIKKYSAEKTVSILFVSDNGIGLDENRLGAVLGDGDSQKRNERSSVGSWGNGHFTAFALSNLRYIFYGGVLPNNKMIYSGHALLASHLGKYQGVGEEWLLSQDGYFVKKIDGKKEDFSRFDFGDKEDIPLILSAHMERIRKEWGHGALIAIISFNNFGGQKDENAGVILREAALNFFPAVSNGQLEIEIDDNEKSKLNRLKLKDIIEGVKDKQRGRNGFPSGSRIWNAFQTLEHGTEHDIETGFGKIKMYLREEVDDKRISLCRNGMWISDSITKLQPSDFGDRVNFNALLLIDSEYDSDPSDAYKLLKLAETPLHNKIELRGIKNDKTKRDILCLLKEIQEGIKECVEEKKEGGVYDPVDYFPVEVSESARGRTSYNPNGRIQKINANSSGGGGGSGNKGKKGKKRINKFRASNALNAKISSRRIGSSKLLLSLQAGEDCENANIGLSLDTGQDLTCNNSGRIIVYMKDIKVNGQPPSKKLEDEKGTYAVALGEWKEGKIYSLEVEYAIPKGTAEAHTLIVDLARSKVEQEPKNE